MKESKQEKRLLKGYKIKDSSYRKAMRRAQKENEPLATKIERWVCLYSAGYPIIVGDK